MIGPRDTIELARPLDRSVDALVARLAEEDILGQLLRRDGRMRLLGSEGGEPKLDWADGVERALERPEQLAAVTLEAREILDLGFHHIVWAGMGGSVQVVHVLTRLGLADTPRLHFHPCDSTDPASLNRILGEIASQEGLARLDPALLLERTLMIGVSMGMTSEEPITHLEWFDGLLEEARIANPQEHIRVMTLPGSYLDRFAEARGARRVPIQLDGASGTPGRMSAPATRVFLLPAALRLLAGSAQAPRGAALLEPVLRLIHGLAGVEGALDPASRQQRVRADPFIRLGAIVAARARAGKNQVALVAAPEWRGFEPWLEQLVEESLGKGGKGFCLFYGEQEWNTLATDPLVIGLGAGAEGEVALRLPAAESAVERLALAGALCLGFERTIATYGYLEDIVFAGQPGVEAYKTYARSYRDAPGEIRFDESTADSARFGRWTLHAGALTRKKLIASEQLGAEARRLGGDPGDAADLLAAVLSLARARRSLRYLDLTFNGEPPSDLTRILESALGRLANGVLGIPGKIRTGPADYHSTEQSEVDGPDELLSIRLVALEHEPVVAGCYSDKFLLAQARGTWQAMEDAGRWIVMLTVPRLDSRAIHELDGLFARTRQRLAYLQEQHI